MEVEDLFLHNSSESISRITQARQNIATPKETKGNARLHAGVRALRWLIHELFAGGR
jgi:hypothetical protein